MKEIEREERMNMKEEEVEKKVERTQREIRWGVGS